MPTLPDAPEPPPTLPDRIGVVARRASAGIGVPIRGLIFFTVIVIAISMAPTPWAQIGLVGTLFAALDWVRIQRHS